MALVSCSQLNSEGGQGPPAPAWHLHTRFAPESDCQTRGNY
jgi:hypothetical protein